MLKRITPGISLGLNSLLKNLLNIDDLKIQTFTLERNDDECVFQLKFGNMDIKRVDNIINELTKEPAIKEIFGVNNS